MGRLLNRSLPTLVLHQFGSFWYYYIGAFICLYATHSIQGHLPFIARELAVSGATAFDPKIFVYLAVGIIFFRTFSRLLFFHPARILQKKLRLELINRLSHSPPSRYRHYNPGQIFQILGADMEDIRALTGFILLQIANIIAAIIVLVPKIVAFNPSLLVAISPMALASVLFSLIISRNYKYFRRTQDCQGEVNNLILETYSGKKTIKNYHAESSFIELFHNRCTQELSYFFKAGIRTSISIPLIPLGVGLSLLWGSHTVQTLDLGVENLVLFSSFIFLFLEPLAFLSWIGVVYARSSGAWSRISELVADLGKKSPQEILLLKYNNGSENSPISLDFWQRTIDLNISLGQWNVIIGKTGHGKTHLLIQCAEFFKSKGKRISYVAQAPYLYNDTVEKNIFLGRIPNQRETEQAHRLIELFGLDYLASSRAALMQMEIGENGKRLSGGQQKRLSLIRSLMASAEILLWDDPFSSIDLILEKSITKALKEFPLLNGKCVVLTSHRFSTVRSTQRIIYIDKDEGLVEEGNTRDILHKGTKTYEYFQSQFI